MGSPQEDLSRAVELHQSGEFAEAEQLYSAIAEAEPHLPDPIHLLGVLAHQTGQNAKAIELIEQAISLRPDVSQYYTNLGVALTAVGRFRDAVKTLGRAIELAPEAQQPLVNLGNVYFNVGQFQHAVQCFQKALRIKPDHQPALLNLGISMRVLGNNAQSVEIFSLLLRLNPKSTMALSNLGLSLNNLGHTEKAIESLSLAIQFDPEGPMAATNLAAVYAQTGEFEKAELIARDVLHRHPTYCRAFSVLSKLGTSIDQDDAERLSQLVEMSTLPVDDMIAANYSLARYYDRQQQYEQAWSQASVANGKRVKRHDYRSHEQYITRLTEAYSKEYFARETTGHQSNRPVFVVGLPRSGTSLVEQILASHPLVHGAGELDEFEQLRQKLDSTPSLENAYPESMSGLTQQTVLESAERYLARIESLNASAERVVDKLPDNFLHLGLIATLFPNSRVIHCRRHPLDICVSCFLEDFEYVDYTTDLDLFVDYYLAYDRLMKHWEQNLPIDLMSVQYETFVENPAVEIRRLIEFCGVDWDDNCLNFHVHERTVRTPSSYAVRQPIFKSSAGRWRNYQSELRDVGNRLREAGVIAD
jgi:Flp pilus assembly protein TadD